MSKKTYSKYPAYKDSGVEWLGVIPENWDLTRLGSYFKERRTKVSDKDYSPLSVTKQGILPQLDSAAKTNDGDNRKLVKKGDFVINSRSDRKGSSGIASKDGSVSLINIVMKPISIQPTFCNYLLKSNAFVEENYRIGHGIVADLWTTRYDEMKNIKIGIPSPSEQTAIAVFLDDKTAKIDQAIAQKEQLIALLKERKQIIIQHAVTKGLDPHVRLKDSGVEWIGEIPEHWVVVKAKYTFGKIEQGWSPQCDSYVANKNQWGVLKVGCVNYGSFKENENKLLPLSLKPRLEYQIQEGDILISRANTLELVGSAACVINLTRNLILCDKLYRISSYSKVVDKLFFISLFKTSIARRQIEIAANGASPSMQNIGQDVIKNMVIPLCTLKEQRGIVDFIDCQSSKIDQSISLQQIQIQKLKEYKATLIDSAVTGKIKVT